MDGAHPQPPPPQKEKKHILLQQPSLSSASSISPYCWTILNSIQVCDYVSQLKTKACFCDVSSVANHLINQFPRQKISLESFSISFLPFFSLFSFTSESRGKHGGKYTNFQLSQAFPPYFLHSSKLGKLSILCILADSITSLFVLL